MAKTQRKRCNIYLDLPPRKYKTERQRRHGGQTFYEHMVEIGEAQDLNRITGDETDEQLQDAYERRRAEWRNGTHPDAVPDEDHGDEQSQGDEQGQGDGHDQDEHGQGDDYDNGDRDKGKRKRARSESDVSHESSDSGHRGDDEDDSGTPSTNRTRPMPNSESGSRSPKRRKLSEGASNAGRREEKTTKHSD